MKYTETERIEKLRAFLEKPEGEKREHMEILAEILLKALNKGAIKTRIVYGGNLNFKMFDSYLKELGASGLIERCGSLFKTTEKGLEFLDHFEKLIEILEG